MCVYWYEGFYACVSLCTFEILCVAFNRSELSCVTSSKSDVVVSASLDFVEHMDVDILAVACFASCVLRIACINFTAIYIGFFDSN